MIELIVIAGPWICETEQIMLVAAYRRTEPAGFKYRLRQYDFWIFDVVALYLGKEIWNGKLRQSVNRVFFGFMRGENGDRMCV